MKRRMLLAAALAAPTVAAPAILRAQGATWPDKTVRFICPFAPGGGTDTVSRLICDQLTKLLGQQFIVENKGGAGGNIGTTELARATPDGYTLGLISVASHTLNPMLYSKLPYNPDKDIVGVSRVATLANLLGVTPSLPANNVAELIALCKASPGKYSFASSGAGTSPHLTGEMFKQMAGVNLLHVPYKGSAPAHQDILAGQVDMMFDNIPGPLGLMKGGKVKGIAVTSKARHPAVPDKPTIAEFLPGFEISSWGGICGPANLPPAMVEKLSALTKKALDTPAVKTAFEQQGATNMWMTPQDTAAYRASEEKKLAPIIKASGAKVE